MRSEREESLSPSRKKRGAMFKQLMIIATVLCGILSSRDALASHFRGGTIRWTVPDPANAPLTVEFTVTTGWAANGSSPVVLDYGSGGPKSSSMGGTKIGTGTDTQGNEYEIREAKVSYTYPSAGNYTAFFASSARIAGLENGAGEPFRVESQVDLSSGNTGGPVTLAPLIIQLQGGDVRTYVFPAVDPDGDPISCRLATDQEANTTGVTPSAGGASPSMAMGPSGCVMTWDLTAATTGQRYLLQVVLESTHAGGTSKSALDLIVEIVQSPPPTCAGSDKFTVNVGDAFSAKVTGTSADGGDLTVEAANNPPSSSLAPTSGPSPLEATFSWTPDVADAGSTKVVLVNFKDSVNVTGTCTLTIQVPLCADSGDPCTVGLGQCVAAGTRVCSGPNQSTCDALPLSPQPEICDGLDNDCNGAIDDATIDSGASCQSGEPGICSAGTTVCEMGGNLACVADVKPGDFAETCNGTDDDCDGETDEGFDLGAACTNGLGACAAQGAMVCDAMGGAVCDAVPGMPQDEICGNDVDEDCDGELDNGCPDTDGDGIFDPVEVEKGTNPTDPDSDDDGVIDGQELFWDTDSDGDGKINALDPDSDNDGLFDGTEMGHDCFGPGTDTSAGVCIPDADMGKTGTSPINADTDNGGLSDGVEDRNKNGAIDIGDLDPNLADDDAVECTEDSQCGGPTSARVCDDWVCIDGCRGANGNTCPEEVQCSSTDETVGECAFGEGLSVEGAGACSASPANDGKGSSALLMGLALSVLRGVRRRRRAA